MEKQKDNKATFSHNYALSFTFIVFLSMIMMSVGGAESSLITSIATIKTGAAIFLIGGLLFVMGTSLEKL